MLAWSGVCRCAFFCGTVNGPAQRPVGGASATVKMSSIANRRSMVDRTRDQLR